MADIIQIKQDGVDKYPITKPECVIDENGKTIKEIVDEMSEKIENLPSGESAWVLKETHTWDGAQSTISVGNLPREFLALFDCEEVISQSTKVSFQIDQDQIRGQYDFAASRQMHIGFHFRYDGVIANVESFYSEWNTKNPSTPKVLYTAVALPQSLTLHVYGNATIPAGTTLKIYTR